MPKRSKTKPAVKKIAKKVIKKVEKVVAKKTSTEKIVKKEPGTKKVESKKIVSTTASSASNKVTKKPSSKTDYEKEKSLKIGDFLKKTKKIEVVNVPKIKSKGSIAYEPEFASSVLNKEVSPTMESRVCYSSEDLRIFKEIILKKMEAARNELAYLQNVISQKNVALRDSGDSGFLAEEEISFDKEQFSQMARRQQQFIDHLEKALVRIENKTYGVCRVTGKLIDKDRLKAVPHATLSMEAKMSIISSNSVENSGKEKEKE